jgi:AcrR family transcriptional regulator
MSRLASSVGGAVGALYRYFPGKDDIIVALQRRAIEGFRLDLDADLAAAGDESALELLRVTSLAWLRDAERAPLRHRLIASSLSAPDRQLSDADVLAVHASIQPVLSAVVSLINRAVDAGELSPGDAMQRTHVLWATLQGLDHFRKLDRLRPVSLQTETLAIAALDALFTGWAP